MKLPPQEAELFYKLMWPLQFHVNQQRHILPHVDSLEAYIECPFCSAPNLPWYNER